MTASRTRLFFLSWCLILAVLPALAVQDNPPLPLPDSPSGPTEPEAPAPEAPAPEAPDDGDSGPPADEPAGAEANAPPAGRGGGRGGRGGGPLTYDRVITDETETEVGVFTIHRIDDQLLYEIPVSELGREFLWVARISKTAAGAGYGGEEIDERVVRWVRQDDRIFLENVSYSIVADEDDPIALAVRAANNNAIIQAFDIIVMGPDDESIVIDVTNLFVSEVPEFSARQTIGGRGFDRRRSYLSDARAFPGNLEVRAVQTFTRSDDGGGRGGRGGGQTGSATIEMAFSMVGLPAEPMRARLFDERVGYFTTNQTDFSAEQHRASRRRYITRWRLEKADPDADVSDVVTPIEFWIDPATPSEWIPYIRRGVEAWQPAFEAAGYGNAIVARDAPTAEEDPDWSPEDARYSVIRWLPTTVENASGPNIHDPRTGEILEADIEIHHNVMNLARNWYFVQASPLDQRAQTLPLPDDLMGELLQFVVTHEVGHTLGLLHNQKGSSTYPLENLRDADWLEEMGYTPSIMDYARFNYVAQPEDDIPPELLIPKLGPYDYWAIHWGYAEIPDTEAPGDEEPVLDAWAREQDTTPWYRFSTDNAGSANPGEVREAIGDSDAVEATRLGLLNLERVMGYLLDATTHEGENWDELEELYDQVLDQWALEMSHVAGLVGGYDYVQTRGGQETLRFTPVPGDRQEGAVRFLIDYAFRTPDFIIRPEILRRIEREGILGRVRDSQGTILDSLLDADRFTRLAEQHALDALTYTPTRFLEDLRRGVWSELFEPTVSTDAFRRNLQRVYLELIEERIDSDDAIWNDMRAFLRGQLRALDGEVQAAMNRIANTDTRYHLEDVRDEIARILDPSRVRREQPQGPPGGF